MKRLLIAAGIVLALSIGLVAVASADNGPHGGYTATTDACAGCHRAHTGQGANLLKTGTADNQSFCYSCHGNAAQGAYTDVYNGVLMAPTVIFSETTTSPITPAVPLKGGGFVNAKMNTDFLGASSRTATSSHSVDGTPKGAWGFGAISASSNITGTTGGATGVDLTCVNCHNPHGRAGKDATTGEFVATYRILRGARPFDSNKPYLGDPSALFVAISGTTTLTATSTVNVADETTHDYAVSDLVNSNYFLGYGTGDYGTARLIQISTFCAGCHTRYLAPSGSAGVNSGDAVFKYRHAIKQNTSDHGPSCLTCHVAHGTTARTDVYSQPVAWPDGSASTATNSRSALLRLDNRGVCQGCHNK